MELMSRDLTLVALLVLALCHSVHCYADSPAKRSRSLTSDDEIRQIRENIARYPAAKAIADDIIAKANKWVDKPDRVLWEMIPPADIPRAFNSSFDGCPVHGKEYFKYGNYSWKMDIWNRPWKLKCPVGGEEYPSNDFWAYYKTKDRSLLTGDYPDDGWGWRKPGDKYKHWFVAYYCHWLWMNHLLPAVTNLSIAYQITGDEKYARKAIVMLDRIADLYPEMDHNKQSRYAAEFSPTYTGRIVNRIWEVGTATSLASAYDSVFDLLASDGEFSPPDGAGSPLHGKTNADIRRNIEQNILRECVESVFDGRIQGNYGMHQRALLILAIVLQDDDLTRKATDWILNGSAGSWASEGFYYALDNFITREGVSFESAPGYCLGWSVSLASVGEYLDMLGLDIFANTKFRRMFTAYEELQVLGMFTPAIGDSGSVRSGAYNLPPWMARLGLEKWRDPLFARHLLNEGAFGERSFANYRDLRKPPLSEDDLRRRANDARGYSGSRNLGSYGLGILEWGTGKEGVGAAVYYGPAVAAHGHFDKPFMEVYGFGKKLIPDFGYPQFAAESKDPAAWEEHNLSHYTVTVNGSKQATAKKGVLNHFAVTPDIRLLDVSAPDAYPFLREYRRIVLMIGSESESPYLVDCFVVKGGTSHDYSIHGFTSEVTIEGLDLSPVQEKGTLAGENVPYSFLYDDPDLENPERTRSFGTYTGSAYSYLYDVQRGIPTRTWSAVWADDTAGIRAIFPRQPLTEAVVASGNPPKRPNSPDSLKYILLRRSGEDDLKSRFVCVLQPFRTGDAPDPLVVNRVPAGSGDLIEITGPHGTDLIYLSGDPNEDVQIGGLHARGHCVVLRMDRSRELKSVFISGGGYVRQGLLTVESGLSLRGHVGAFDFKANEITVSHTDQTPAEQLAGSAILFGRTSYTIRSCSSKDGSLVLGLGEDNPRVGRVLVNGLDPDGRFISTSNLLYFASGGCYRNVWVVNEDFTAWHRITDVDGGKLLLDKPADLKSEFTDRDGDGRIFACIYDIAPGQEFVIPAASWAGRDRSGKWVIQSNCSVLGNLPDGTRLDASSNRRP